MIRYQNGVLEFVVDRNVLTLPITPATRPTDVINLIHNDQGGDNA